MRQSILAAGLVACLALLIGGPARAAAPEVHRLALQITDANPTSMNMVLNVAGNVMSHYQEKGEKVEIKVVAFGPGLMMLRADKSPVKERLIGFMNTHKSVEFDACNNTLQGMAKKEGKVPPLLPGVSVVPSGAVALLELNEQGWTILRP
jgi:intracellular sulfur oxidation DsrE/DsrF family protein